MGSPWCRSITIHPILWGSLWHSLFLLLALLRLGPLGGILLLASLGPCTHRVLVAMLHLVWPVERLEANCLQRLHELTWVGCGPSAQSAFCDRNQVHRVAVTHPAAHYT